MGVFYSKQVKGGLKEYEKSLKTYPISKERAILKVRALKLALRNVGVNPNVNPICLQQDLGQTLLNGRPINHNLRRYNYKDESGFQWAFSYLITGANIMFIKMLPSRFVIKESQLRNIIKESIRKVLNII